MIKSRVYGGMMITQDMLTAWIQSIEDASIEGNPFPDEGGMSEREYAKQMFYDIQTNAFSEDELVDFVWYANATNEHIQAREAFEEADRMIYGGK